MDNNTLERIVLELAKQVDRLVTALTDKTSLCKYSLYSWLDTWYEVYKLPYLKPSGAYQIHNCIVKHLKPYLPNKPLDLVTAIDIQKAIQQITSSRMRKYSFDTISACLRQAYKLDIISINVSSKLTGVKHVRNQGTALTLDEEKHFIKIIHGMRFENLFLFYLSSGVRKSEALAIKWTDIDYSNNRLYIDGTKTTCSKRYIPLFLDIRNILVLLPHTSEYVFPYYDYSVANAWRYLSTKYDLSYSIHSLRHTFSTRHYENGVPIKIIQKWLGHAKAETTQNIYTDVLPDFEKIEFQKADNARHVTTLLFDKPQKTE